VDLPPSYRSFLVRLWRDPPEAGGAWRGEVESIQSGELLAVESLEQALAILWRATGMPAEPPAQSDAQGENR
jgi:hypothetical protein